MVAPGSGALAETLAVSCGSHAAFCRASGRDSSRRFGVKHFAGQVFYEASQKRDVEWLKRCMRSRKGGRLCAEERQRPPAGHLRLLEARHG